MHEISLCDCSFAQRVIKSIIHACKGHSINQSQCLENCDVVNIKLSLRARAKLAQNKLDLASFENIKIKIVRQYSESMSLKNLEGTMNEEQVVCHHSIISTGDMLPCDCSRDVNNRLQLSEKVRALPKNNIVLYENY